MCGGVGEGNVQDDGRREALGRNDTETVMRKGHKRQMQRQQVEEKYTQGCKKMERDTGIQSDTERGSTHDRTERGQGKKEGEKEKSQTETIFKHEQKGKGKGRC